MRPFDDILEICVLNFDRERIFWALQRGLNRLREACNSIISENQFTVFLIYGRVPKIHLIHPNPRWAERWAIKPTTGNHILGTSLVNFFSPLHLHNFNQPNSINIQYESLARNGWKGKCQSISPEGQLEVEVKLLASSLSPRTFSQGKLHRNSPTKTNNFSPPTTHKMEPWTDSFTGFPLMLT